MTEYRVDAHNATVDALHRWAEVATLLSVIFQKEIDEPFLRTIVENCRDLCAWAEAQGEPDLTEGTRLLGETVRRAREVQDNSKLIERLAVEHASLFYGIGETPVDVVESVYRGQEHTLYGSVYFRVLEIYERCGYEKPRELAEPEDHISAELDFLAFQCRGAVWDLERGAAESAQERIAVAADFCRRHLNRWAPSLCVALIKSTKNPFYLAAGYLTSGFLRIVSGSLLGEEANRGS
ncbi:MAG: molecular chaperone [Coriobacteriia bacterium]